jgi:type II secretory pathway pseudopilin PulG
MKREFRIQSRRRRQGGVALIVALVVLVIIGLTSAAVMRGALNSDLVANNTRVQALATQAAQVALKYCETQWNAGALPPFIVLPAPGAQTDPLEWETFGNWSNVNKTNEVPIEFMKSELSSVVPATLPQCMVQRSTVGVPGATSPTIVIVARGFSPDFRAEQGTGRTEAGSVVWLQYILAL